jgi:hypothetical protein
MPAPARSWVCVALATGLAFLPARAEEGQVLERFAVARDGDALLLPVTFRGKTYQFGLDSGSTWNVFDTALPLGDPLDERPAWGTDSLVRLRFFPAPQARTGGLNLKTTEPVVAFDCARFRRVLGSDIHGFLGMPFFRRHVLRVDFDQGEVLVLQKAGPDCGRGFAVRYDERRVPLLRIDVAGDTGQEVAIETGWTGSVCLAEPLFDTAVKQEDLAVVGTMLSETVSGTLARRLGRLKQLTLGEFTPRGLLTTAGKGSRLGLGFWSRFVVTFDLPHDKVYLKRGKEFDRPDVHDLSGLHLLRQDGQVVVHSVGKGSAAEAAGLKSGDVLVRVGDTRVEAMSLFRLRKCFCVGDTRVRLTVRRGGKETEITLALGNEQGAGK